MLFWNIKIKTEFVFQSKEGPVTKLFTPLLFDSLRHRYGANRMMQGHFAQAYMLTQAAVTYLNSVIIRD